MRLISICFLSIVLTLLVYSCFSSRKRGDEDDFGFDETDVGDSARTSSGGVDGGYAAAGGGVVIRIDAGIVDVVVQEGTGRFGGTEGTGGAGGIDIDDDAGMNDAPCAPNCPDLDWVTIPGGTFIMGSAEGVGEDNERPQHEVTIQTFRISKTEVTISQYEMCLDEGVCGEPWKWDIEDLSSWGVPGRENHPIDSVDWYQATAFANWIGGRLLTEAEWEYAARSGGQAFLYPWGEEGGDCEYTVTARISYGHDCNYEATMPVCSKPLDTTVQGVCDMAGNVAEWVQDDWHENFIGAPSDGQAWIDSPRIDGRGCVLRGGNWRADFDTCRTTSRGAAACSDNPYFAGIRVVVDLE